MSIFTGKKWINVVSAIHKSIQTKCINLAGDKVYFGEWKLFTLKKWLLYGELETNVEQKLGLLEKQAKTKNVFLIESNFNMSRWQCLGLLEKYGQITMPFGTYIINLDLSEAELWKNLHSKHRNVIRRALKKEVEIKHELDLTEFKVLLDHTYAKGGKSNRFNLKYLTSLQSNLKGSLIAAGAYHRGVLQAGLIVPFDQARGYYLHGATLPNCILGSSNLLHWEIIKELKSRGVKEYDLGGARRKTDDPRLRGIFRFKARFGGEFIDCYYWEKILNKRAYTLYKALMRLRNVLTNYS